MALTTPPPRGSPRAICAKRHGNFTKRGVRLYLGRSPGLPVERPPWSTPLPLPAVLGEDAVTHTRTRTAPRVAAPEPLTQSSHRGVSTPGFPLPPPPDGGNPRTEHTNALTPHSAPRKPRTPPLQGRAGPGPPRRGTGEGRTELRADPGAAPPRHTHATHPASYIPAARPPPASRLPPPPLLRGGRGAAAAAGRGG